MTVNELKAIITLQHKDSIIVTKNNEIVRPEGTEIVKALQSTGDWDGYVQHEIHI